MARSRIYQVANRTAQWWEDKYSRTTMNPVSKLLLHTTETAGWPAYSAGASAPSLTYNPWMAASSNRWRQHNYLDRSSRALRDPSGTAVRENQDGVVQVEIVCYCDPGLYRQYGKGVNALPDHAYEDLGNLLAFLNREWSVPLRRAPEWDTYPPSDSIRMTGPEYDAFTGVLGHQHASGNTHGDPGMTNAQVDRILTVAKRINGGGSVPAKPPVTPSLPEVLQMELDDIVIAAQPAKPATATTAAVPAQPAVTVRGVLSKQYWLAQQFAQSGQFEDQLDRIETAATNHPAGA
jgi:hypothetical protein